ncbi:MAG: pro-sigmaK processing inhibitor BofA family protein [Bacilli bacterium]|nr:pro-sigmaK processing inhibitor BofA family protein [Bacilli bacterium]
MNNIIKIIKRIVVSFGLLYTYNIVMQPINLPIPINIINLIILFLLDIPGFLGIIVFYMINFR